MGTKEIKIADKYALTLKPEDDINFFLSLGIITPEMGADALGFYKRPEPPTFNWNGFEDLLKKLDSGRQIIFTPFREFGLEGLSGIVTAPKLQTGKSKGSWFGRFWQRLFGKRADKNKSTDENDFGIASDHSGGRTRGQHEAFHEEGKFNEIIKEIADEIGAPETNGEFDLRSVIQKAGGKLVTSHGELRIEQDGVLVIIDNRFQKDHAGRDRYQVLATEEPLAQHELAELREWRRIAIKWGLINPRVKPYEARMGQALRDWANGRGNRGPQGPTIWRQNVIKRLTDEIHQMGLKAEESVRNSQETKRKRHLVSPTTGVGRGENDPFARKILRAVIFLVGHVIGLPRSMLRRIFDETELIIVRKDIDVSRTNGKYIVVNLRMMEDVSDFLFSLVAEVGHRIHSVVEGRLKIDGGVAEVFDLLSREIVHSLTRVINGGNMHGLGQRAFIGQQFLVFMKLHPGVNYRSKKRFDDFIDFLKAQAEKAGLGKYAEGFALAGEGDFIRRGAIEDQPIHLVGDYILVALMGLKAEDLINGISPGEYKRRLLIAARKLGFALLNPELIDFKTAEGFITSVNALSVVGLCSRGFIPGLSFILGVGAPYAYLLEGIGLGIVVFRAAVHWVRMRIISLLLSMFATGKKVRKLIAEILEQPVPGEAGIDKSNARDSNERRKVVAPSPAQGPLIQPGVLATAPAFNHAMAIPHENVRLIDPLAEVTTKFHNLPKLQLEPLDLGIPDADFIIASEGERAGKGKLPVVTIAQAQHPSTSDMRLYDKDFSIFNVKRSDRSIPRYLFAVHATNYLPENGAIKTTMDATRGRFPRDTIHWSLNHVVESHAYGNWDDAKYIVVVPLQSLVEANPGQVMGGSPVDFVFGGNITLPDGIEEVSSGRDVKDLAREARQLLESGRPSKPHIFRSRRQADEFLRALEVYEEGGMWGWARGNDGWVDWIHARGLSFAGAHTGHWSSIWEKFYKTYVEAYWAFLSEVQHANTGQAGAQAVLNRWGSDRESPAYGAANLFIKLFRQSGYKRVPDLKTFTEAMAEFFIQGRESDDAEASQFRALLAKQLSYTDGLVAEAFLRALPRHVTPDMLVKAKEILTQGRLSERDDELNQAIIKTLQGRGVDIADINQARQVLELAIQRFDVVNREIRNKARQFISGLSQEVGQNHLENILKGLRVTPRPSFLDDPASAESEAWRNLPSWDLRENQSELEAFLEEADHQFNSVRQEIETQAISIANEMTPGGITSAHRDFFFTIYLYTLNQPHYDSVQADIKDLADTRSSATVEDIRHLAGEILREAVLGIPINSAQVSLSDGGLLRLQDITRIAKEPDSDKVITYLLQMAEILRGVTWFDHALTKRGFDYKRTSRGMSTVLLERVSVVLQPGAVRAPSADLPTNSQVKDLREQLLQRHRELVEIQANLEVEMKVMRNGLDATNKNIEGMRKQLDIHRETWGSRLRGIFGLSKSAAVLKTESVLDGEEEHSRNLKKKLDGVNEQRRSIQGEINRFEQALPHKLPPILAIPQNVQKEAASKSILAVPASGADQGNKSKTGKNSTSLYDLATPILVGFFSLPFVVAVIVDIAPGLVPILPYLFGFISIGFAGFTAYSIARVMKGTDPSQRTSSEALPLPTLSSKNLDPSIEHQIARMFPNLKSAQIINLLKLLAPPAVSKGLGKADRNFVSVAEVRSDAVQTLDDTLKNLGLQEPGREEARKARVVSILLAALNGSKHPKMVIDFARNVREAAAGNDPAVYHLYVEDPTEARRLAQIFQDNASNRQTLIMTIKPGVHMNLENLKSSNVFIHQARQHETRKDFLPEVRDDNKLNLIAAVFNALLEHGQPLDSITESLRHTKHYILDATQAFLDADLVLNRLIQERQINPGQEAGLKEFLESRDKALVLLNRLAVPVERGNLGRDADTLALTLTNA